jgi:hypothetical protein
VAAFAFGHDGSTGGTSTRLEDSLIPASYRIVLRVMVELRTDISIDSAVDQCARRFGESE